MTETRTAIAEHVATNPGVHFSGLVRELDLAPGQVQYHLRRLRADETVVAEDLYGRTHLYPPGFTDWERRALALLRRETARDLLGHLMADGPTPAADLAADLDVARSTLQWHLDRLVAADLVEKRRDGNRVVVALADPDATARLLAAVSPSLPDRMVDRFARLVDRLLSEG